MRKRWLLAALSALCFALLFVGCTAQKPVYTVTYINGAEVFYTDTAEEGAPLPRPDKDPEKAEDDTYTYTFKGWSLSEGGEIADLASVTEVTEAMTFYAVFEPVEKPVFTYTVTFVDGLTGKPIGEPQSVKEGESAVAPEPPVHEGYTFTGWDKDFTNITVRTEVKALYTVNSYTLTTEVLGEEKTQEIEYGGSLELGAPETPEGLIFAGWYVKEDGEAVLLTEKYPDGMPAAAVSAYAAFGIDWSGVSLDTADAVYGGKAAVTVPDAEGFSYTYVWGDDTAGPEFAYKAAGEQDVKVTVRAEYKSGNATYAEGEKIFEQTVAVAKAALSVTVKPESGEVAYGTLPQISFDADGFVGEDAAKYEGRFTAVFTDAADAPADGDRLVAGEYTVSAQLPGQSDYELKVTAAKLKVTPKAITLKLTAEDIRYGEEPEYTVSSDGFAYGEDMDVLSGGSVVFKKDGAIVSGSLSAGVYTAETQGYASENYSVTQASAQFEVSKATLTVTVRTDKTQYVYAESAVPSYVVDESGLVNGDIAGVVTGEPSYVFTKEGEEVSGVLPVGSYGVTVKGLSADNYELKIVDGSFIVIAREVLLEAEASQKSGAEWIKSDFAPALPDGCTFSGTLVLNTTDAGEYKLEGTSLEGTLFAWSVPAKVLRAEEDVTANFVFRFAVAVKLEEIDFDVDTVENFTAVYTGNEIELGKDITVNDPPEGLKIEYKLGEEGSYAEALPKATDAGVYTVYFRLSAPNYTAYKGSYKATITQAANKIAETTPFGTYTYTGQEQTVEFASHLKADFGEIVLKEGNTNIVKDAGEYSFTVCVAETENYAGAEYTVEITVGKATYTEGQIPAQKVADDDIVAGMNKTLADVALAEGFAWTDDSLGYKAGENTAAATYCGDAKNYETYSLQITFTARRENITIFADGTKLEADFGTSSFTEFAAALSAKDEKGESFTLVDLSTLCTAAFVNIDYTTGGTYAVRYTLTKTEDDYYAFAFENAGDGEYFAPFKLKSVKLGDTLYTIEDALAKAVSGNTVIVTANTAFASADTLSLLNGVYSAGGHYTVKEGVTLLVPYDTGYSENTKDCDVNYEAVGTSPFATLTVSSGVSLSVNGKLIVNAKIVQRSGVTSTVKGNLYGAMNVCADASITLEEGAVYESIGFSYGEGIICTKAGANVYELFNMVGYKGGTISDGIKNTVFPLNQYGMTSISCKLEIVYGANYYAKAFTAALSNLAKVDADVLFISNTQSSFLQVVSENGKIRKWIDENNGEICFETDGDVQFNNMSVELGSYALDTTGKEIPIPGNFKFFVNSGTATIPADISIKLLPGMELVIKENARLDVYGRIYSYGTKDSSYSMAMTDGGEPLETWQDGNQSVKAYPLGDMKNVYRKVPTLDYTASSPAVISVAGSINVYAGAYFACEVSGVQNGKLHFDSASELTGTIQEDFSHIEKKWGIINTCIEVYFTTTIKTVGANGEVFEKGKDYTYDGATWTAQA